MWSRDHIFKAQYGHVTIQSSSVVRVMIRHDPQPVRRFFWRGMKAFSELAFRAGYQGSLSGLAFRVRFQGWLSGLAFKAGFQGWLSRLAFKAGCQHRVSCAGIVCWASEDTNSDPKRGGI